MADCSTVEEALHADELGFDLLERLWFGYTEQSKGRQDQRPMTLRSSKRFNFKWAVKASCDRRRKYQRTGKLQEEWWNWAVTVWL